MDNSAQGYPNPDLLVETDWLEEHLDDEGLRVVDCDVWDAYRKGHIVGAVGVRDHYWKNPYDPVHVMTPEQFAHQMSAMGIGDDTLVIAYDGSKSQYAGRFWWAMNYYGHEKVRVLNGGWRKWLLEGRSITTAESSYPTGTFTPKTKESLIATGDYIKSALDRKDLLLVDVRHDHEYGGTRPAKSDARQYRPMAITPTTSRIGHIRGAVQVEANYVLTHEPWTYCWAGGRSGHGLFTLKLMGFERARLFDAGWYEWGNREDVPIEG